MHVAPVTLQLPTAPTLNLCADEEFALWWAQFDSELPPLQLTAPGLRILRFGWAPAAEEELEPEDRGEDEEDEEEVSRGEPEYGIVLRLWVTIIRGQHMHTQLIDLHGNILGAFELPVSGGAVAWLRDGRRVQVTESSTWFPSLWDGAALHGLPVPAGFGEIEVFEESWCCDDGRKGMGVLFGMRGTACDAPIIVVRHLPPTFASLLPTIGQLCLTLAVHFFAPPHYPDSPPPISHDARHFPLPTFALLTAGVPITCGQPATRYSLECGRASIPTARTSPLWLPSPQDIGQC